MIGGTRACLTDCRENTPLCTPAHAPSLCLISAIEVTSRIYTIPMASTSKLTSNSMIPLVDFNKWTADGSSRLQIARDIVAACKKVGFVYIVNHSVPDHVLDEALKWSQIFFDLPQDDKLKAPHPEGWAVHRGYSRPGLEKVSQEMSADNDQEQVERVKQLREIPDFKVSDSSLLGTG